MNDVIGTCDPCGKENVTVMEIDGMWGHGNYCSECADQLSREEHSVLHPEYPYRLAVQGIPSNYKSVREMIEDTKVDKYLLVQENSYYQQEKNIEEF